MRSHVLLAFGLSLLGPGCAGTAGQATKLRPCQRWRRCPTTTEAENIAIVRVWHEEVINRQSGGPADILGPEVVHHAAGGYPDTMTADEVVAMMSDFPAPSRTCTTLRSARRAG